MSITLRNQSSRAVQYRLSQYQAHVRNCVIPSAALGLSMKKYSGMSDAITTPNDIPSLHDLYASGELETAKSSPFQPSDEINKRVSIWRGNIVKLKAGMIVNAANTSLLGGGGVDGAIHRAAGSGLLDECRTLNGAKTGETKVTRGYNLPATHVAHTVGPVYSSSNVQRSAERLESCYKTSLDLCAKLGAETIGFSSISTGVYGYPIHDATKIALKTTREFLEADATVARVIFVVFSERDNLVYRSLAPEYFPHPK